MGQKVNPNGFRIGVIRDWNTRWYAPKKDFADFLVEDHKIREFVKKKYYAANISRIGIDRAAGKISVSIFTARPGMLIGKGGAGIDAIKADIANEIGKPVNVNIMEIRDPDADAQLVAENIAAQLEKRISFRRAMKQAMQRAMQRPGVKGIKLSCAGRLGGAEIARSEGYHERSPAARDTMTVPSPCRPCARTSTTGSRKPTPPTAGSAARFGSTRAKCLGRPSARKEADNHVDAEESEAPQGVPRQDEGHRPSWQHYQLRRIRPGSSGALLDHQHPDRGRSCGHDPFHQAWRSGLDQDLPG